MALIKKDVPNNKKDLLKEAPKKALVLSKEKKAVVKKDSSKVIAKKDQENRIELTKKFFRGVLNELKKVHWLSRREVVVYTSVVLLAVIAVGCLIWLFDSLLSMVLGLIIQR
ncbi:MAG: preprotein translocase subunit SecE [Pelotomaculum sp. PtaB.Bin104]|nr:MAG: preprotein translocase subunit SecE [Pelotomaculum sp. PtaB.Bin104]